MISEILRKFGDETVNIIRINLAQTNTNATGQTSASVRSEMIGENRVVVSGRSFIYSVETGRRPGGMPPIENIKEWIDAKGLDLNEWAVAKKIARDGSALFRKGGRTDIITPAVSEERLQQLAEDITREEAKLFNDVIDGAIS